MELGAHFEVRHPELPVIDKKPRINRAFNSGLRNDGSDIFNDRFDIFLVLKKINI